MATTEQIDALVAQLTTNPQAIYDLIELYLDSNTKLRNHPRVKSVPKTYGTTTSN